MPFGGGVYIATPAAATGKAPHAIRSEPAAYDLIPRRKTEECGLGKDHQGPALLGRGRHLQWDLASLRLNVGAGCPSAVCSGLIILAGFIAATAVKRGDAALSKHHH